MAALIPTLKNLSIISEVRVTNGFSGGAKQQTKMEAAALEFPRFQTPYGGNYGKESQTAKQKPGPIFSSLPWTMCIILPSDLSPFWDEVKELAVDYD